MFKYEEFPAWDEVKKDISQEDLRDIIDMALNNDSNIEEAVTDYIESNYEGKIVVDADAVRDSIVDEEL